MKKFVGLASTALLVAGFAAPVVASAQDFSAVIVTDIGGVDDKSFNQSAWEGLTEFGKENNLEKGVGGYDYIQSNSDSDYVTNLNSAVTANFSLTFGIGYKLEAAINDIAQQHPDKHFAIVDSVVDQPNVASLTFKDNEAAFLAGVAAAKTTATKKVGFIGGVEGFVIDRFEAGFVEGVKAVDPSIEVVVEYAGSFADAAKGKQLAAAMYSNDVDVIFHASGATGNGVFSEAKDIVANDPSKNIWVIGVDLDQDAEGIVEVDGKERHLTLASTLKGVGAAVKQFSQLAKDGKFEAGVKTYGLADGGVDLTEGQLSDDAKAAVKEFKEKIIKGEIEVPEKPAE
ncbi:BMP family protein [Aerococcaceae bacterium NML190938]|nr:BMP family protein [Aerococcaceae bacterium NML190938]MCW6675297.1 BMP family protein [Aerococcaceae bacterium NML171108]MCW6677201.1 BMP family protein [Aerococcaceae bacterium NML180378]MCW6680633.1 BMP family protein [Aerococcaceae bacterium NML130460]